MSVIGYLKRVERLSNEIICRTMELREFRATIESLQSIDYSKDKVQTSGGNPLEDNVIKLTEIEQEIQKDIDKMVDLKIAISKQISELSDGDERDVLRYRYILAMEWTEVANRMNYGIRNVHNIHERAIVSFGRKHCT